VGAELCPVSSKPQAVQNGCCLGNGSWRQTSITAPARWPFLQRLDQVGIDHRHTPGVDEQGRGLEALEQRRVVQVVGRGVRQQVEHVVDLANQRGRSASAATSTNGACSRALLATPYSAAKRLQELGHTLADVAGADDQHLAPFQAAPRAVIPPPLDLADQARQHLALVASM
jgi:hypothetical protein